MANGITAKEWRDDIKKDVLEVKSIILDFIKEQRQNNEEFKGHIKDSDAVFKQQYGEDKKEGYEIVRDIIRNSCRFDDTRKDVVKRVFVNIIQEVIKYGIVFAFGGTAIYIVLEKIG